MPYLTLFRNRKTLFHSTCWNQRFKSPADALQQTLCAYSLSLSLVGRVLVWRIFVNLTFSRGRQTFHKKPNKTKTLPTRSCFFLFFFFFLWPEASEQFPSYLAFLSFFNFFSYYRCCGRIFFMKVQSKKLLIIIKKKMMLQHYKPIFGLFFMVFFFLFLHASGKKKTITSHQNYW